MKIVISFLVLFTALTHTGLKAQPGKYADAELKLLIHTAFTDERNIPGLEGYELLEGVLLNRLDDPERMFLNIYSKGTSRVLLFTVLTDTANFIFKVLDVLQVKNVKPGLEFKSVTCRQQKRENSEIVALVRLQEKEYLTDVRKAWICDKIKKQFRWIPLKGVDCLNEGYEQF